jgi:hypothetical protein
MARLAATTSETAPPSSKPTTPIRSAGMSCCASHPNAMSVSARTDSPDSALIRSLAVASSISVESPW